MLMPSRIKRGATRVANWRIFADRFSIDLLVNIAVPLDHKATHQNSFASISALLS